MCRIVRSGSENFMLHLGQIFDTTISLLCENRPILFQKKIYLKHFAQNDFNILDNN